MTDPDERIAALFRQTERAPDEQFVARLTQLAMVEEHGRRARDASLRTLAAQGGTTATLVAAFLLLAGLGPADAPTVAMLSPTMAALILFAVWSVVTLAPDAARERIAA